MREIPCWACNGGPVQSGGSGDYPAAWPEIAARVKEAAGRHCEHCGHPHDPETGHTLTVPARPGTGLGRKARPDVTGGIRWYSRGG